MSLVCEIPEDVAVMCRVELSCRCQVSLRGISIFVWFPMQPDHARSAYELATLQAVSYYLGLQNVYG
jgi:hypothetical protein